MMKIFTNFNKLSSLLLFVFGVSMLNAQEFEFRVDAPAAIAGRYKLYPAQFGPKNSDEIKDKPMKLGTPIQACQDITNDLSGHIAFLDRGACNFIDKVRRAQNKGAIAVIICNNDNPPTNPGLVGTDDITIKSFLMEKTPCVALKAAITGGTATTGNIVIRPCLNEQIPSNAIWGKNPGEGDFKDGPGAWSIDTEPGKGWVWSKDGDASQGAYAGAFFIASQTGCNGSMVFDSDFLDNGGTAGAFGTGTCPAPCVSSFTSPNIPLTDPSITGLSVQFTQMFRQFQSSFLLLASYDDGVKWDTFAVNSDAPVNSNAFLSDVQKIGLCNADLTKKQVKLRFLMNANYYFWGIDDVFILNESGSDPQTNANFYSVAPTYKTPKAQVSSIPLLSDIRNNGPLASENTVLTATLSDAAGTVLKTETNSYGTVDGCEQIENVLFTNDLAMPNTTGLYNLDYNIATSSTNLIATNDKRTSIFEITDDLYANAPSEVDNGGKYLRMFGSITSSTFIGQNDMAVGQYFFFPKGNGYKAHQFSFGVEDDVATTMEFGSILTMEVYEIKKGAENNQDSLVDENERILVGEGYDSRDITTKSMFVSHETPDRRLLTFKIKNLNEQPLTLKDNTGYLFLIRTSYVSGPAYNAASPVHIFPFLGFNHESTVLARAPQGSLNTSAVDYANHTLKSPNKERNYGSVINNGTKIVGQVTVKIYNELQVLDVNVGTEEVLDNNAFTVYPNPANSSLYVDVNLNNISKNVIVEVSDLSGKILATQTKSNTKSGAFSFDVSAFAAGIHLVKITTEEGVATKKVVINRN